MTRIPPLVAAFVAFCAATMAVHTLLPVGSGLQGISFQAAGIAAVAAAVAGVVRNRLTRSLPVWFFVAGLVLLAAGDALWNLYDHVLAVERPFPSPGDWVYLCAYVAILAAALLVHGRRPQLGDVLDGAIVLVGASFVLWFVLIKPAATDPSLSAAGRVLSIAFPAADALLLVALAHLVVTGARSFSANAIALGIAVLFATDVLYGLDIVRGTYVEGGLLDLGWMLSTTLWGAALLHPSIHSIRFQRAPAERRLSGRRFAFLAAAALMTSLLIAFHDGSARVEHLIVAAGSAVTTLLVFARMLLLFRDHGRAVGALRDTEAKRARAAALLQSKARFEQAARALQCAIYEWDTESDELAWSDGLSAAFGHPPDFVSPNSWFLENVHPDDRARISGTLERARSGADRGESTYRFRAADGGYREVWDRWHAQRDGDGEVVGLVGGIVDVTEQRLLEQQFRQTQKMDAIGRLAGGVAHDFNNLLLAIRGNAELLAADGVRAPELCSIVHAADRASQLTTQLLAFSRDELPTAASVDLNAAVADADSMLRRMLGTDVELETSLGEGVGHVGCDAVGIEQIVINLVVNARDAMPDGGTVGIATSRSGDVATLVVADSGFGMDEETARRAFEPFFTTKEVGKGTGLGLATVYAIAERAGGTVAVESDPGRGTRFTLTFPCIQPVADEPRAAEADRQQGTESVLLVEDEPSVRALVARMLEAHGYEVTAAESAEEALELLERGEVDPDLVLSDLMMPGLGGAGLAARLEELRPGQRLLFISGYSDVEPERLGGHRLVPKPFTVGELTHAVREALAPVAA